MDVASEKLFAWVSAAVSAGDGLPYDYLGPQPPPPPLASPGQALSFTGVAGVSMPQITMLELVRRLATNITTPSTSINSGASAAAIAVAFGTATPSGIAGQFQGVPFVLSAAGTLSGAPTSLISTTSNQIRKVLVTIGMSALAGQSSLALAGGSVQFVYGPAVVTSTNAVLSGGQELSYFDYVPLPQASANEVPVGWINVTNSFLVSTGIANHHMHSDLRVLQGLPLSAMMQGLT